MQKLARWLLLLPAIALAAVMVQDAFPDARAAAGSWTGEYFANQTLSGTPAHTRDDGGGTIVGSSPTLDFFWTGSPAPGIPSDGFSVRWTRSDVWAAGQV